VRFVELFCAGGWNTWPVFSLSRVKSSSAKKRGVGLRCYNGVATVAPTIAGQKPLCVKLHSLILPFCWNLEFLGEPMIVNFGRLWLLEGGLHRILLVKFALRTLDSESEPTVLYCGGVFFFLIDILVHWCWQSCKLKEGK